MEKQTGRAKYGQGKRKKLGIITAFHNLKSLREKEGNKFLQNRSSILANTSTVPPKLVKSSIIHPKRVLEQVLNQCLLPHQYTAQSSSHHCELLSGKLEVMKEPTSKEGHCDHELGDITEASAMPKTIVMPETSVMPETCAGSQAKRQNCDHELGDITEASAMPKTIVMPEASVMPETCAGSQAKRQNGDSLCVIRRSVEQLMCEQNSVQNIPSQERQGNVTKSFERGFFGIKGKATKEIFDDSGYFNPHVIEINSESRSLSAQFQLNGGSFTKELTRQELCRKCGKGGRVLNCNNNDCSVAIHESCLASSFKMENTSHFICPLCSYEKTFIAHMKAKGNLEEAHKMLLTFVKDSAVYKKKKGPCAIKVRSTHSDLPSNQQDTCGGPQIPTLVRHDRIVESCQKITNQKNQLNDADDLINHDFSFCTETLNVPSHLAFDDMNRRGKSTVGEDQNCIVEEEQQQSVENCATMDNCNSYNEMDTTLYRDNVFNGSKEGEFCGVQLHAKLPKNQEQEKVIHGHNIEQKRLSPQRDDGLLLSKNTMPFHAHLVVEDTSVKRRIEIDKDHEHQCDKVVEQCEPAKGHEITEDGNLSHEMDASHLENHVRRDKRKGEFCANQCNKNVLPKKDRECKLRRKQNSEPELAFCLRRVPLKWTDEEVEMLKEAVEKIPANDDGSFAWAKILDYGRQVFNKTRTAIDLKDKWRNILISTVSKKS